MIQRNLCKLVQRQTYSCLSHKYGIYFAYSCLVIIVYSTFHFSEELLELTKSHYEAKFSIYSDNVASMTYRRQLSANLPIDIVYTWVNGSDPIFQQKLKELKLNSESFEEEIDGDLCIFDNCVLLPLLMTDGGVAVQPSMFASSYPPFTVTINTNVNSTLYRFESMEKMRKEKVKAERGRNFTLGYFHVTSDKSAPDSNLLKAAVMLKPIPKEIKNKDELEGILPENVKEKIDWLHFDSSKQISLVWLTDDSIVEGLLDSKMENELKNGFKFGADRIDVLPVYHVVIKQNKNFDDISRSRFEDNEELRYSMRSVMKYAPWIRQIFIVTNGQIPSWLDLRVPRVTLVTHEEIFPNKTHLPTFSSPAIESHLHRITGLADHYVYMNDDVMFGKEVWPEDFYTHTGGYKVYLTWPVPNCAEGCPANWIKDGYCDSPCNKTACDFDGGDCVGNNVRSGVGGMNQSPNLLGIGDSWRSTSNNCKPACSNYWLADKFCDQACNHVDCAFDCGDCGTEKYGEIYQIMASSSDEMNGTAYNIPDGHHSAYISLSNIMHGVEDARYQISEGEGSVRVSAVSNKYQLLTILLFPQANKTKVTMKLTGVAPSKNQTQTIMFNITANPSAPKQNSTTTTSTPTTISTTTTTVKKQVEIVEVTPPTLSIRRDEVARWAELNATILVAGGNYSDDDEEVAGELRRLRKELDDGLLTQLGYNRQVGKLLSLNHTRYDVTHEDGGDIDMRLEHVGLGDKNTGDGLNENNLLHQRRLVEYKNEEAVVHRSRTLLDAFGDSLRYVSRIYNRKYGFTKRRVPAHMPHFIDKNIMMELHDKFAAEFDITSSHNLRHAEDMQFAFSYFYYLMSEEKKLNFSDYFQQLDTDGSGILSDRELRTLVTRINDSPLTLDKLTEMETELRNCADSLLYSDPAVRIQTNETGPRSNISRRHRSVISDDDLPTEVYFEKKMPQVTTFLFISCPYITEKLEKAVGKQNKYKFQEMSQDELAFKMLKENVSTVVGQLDDIRKNPKKFICLNDNVDHTIEHAATVKIVVRELLQALFPIPSPFELSDEYRNKFQYISQLEEYKTQEHRYMRLLHAIAIFIICILLSMSFTNELYSLIRPFKRYLLRIYRLVCMGRIRRFSSTGSLKDNV